MRFRLLLFTLLFSSLFVATFSSLGAKPALAKSAFATPVPQGTPQPNQPPAGGGNGDMGVFGPVYDQIAIVSRSAWSFIVGLIVIVVLLGGLWYGLQGAAGASFGGSKTTSTAILGVVGLVLVALMIFLLLPNLGEMLKSFQPKPPF